MLYRIPIVEKMRAAFICTPANLQISTSMRGLASLIDYLLVLWKCFYFSGCFALLVCFYFFFSLRLDYTGCYCCCCYNSTANTCTTSTTSLCSSHSELEHEDAALFVVVPFFWFDSHLLVFVCFFVDFFLRDFFFYFCCCCSVRVLLLLYVFGLVVVGIAFSHPQRRREHSSTHWQRICLLESSRAEPCVLFSVRPGLSYIESNHNQFFFRSPGTFILEKRILSSGRIFKWRKLLVFCSQKRKQQKILCGSKDFNARKLFQNG